MFCPKCDRYLNSNMGECPYCGSKVPCRLDSRTCPSVSEDDPGHDPGSVPEDAKSGDGPPSAFGNGYAVVTLLCGLVLAVCGILPWVTSSSDTGTVTYNAAELLSATWNGVFPGTGIFPAVCSVSSLIIMPNAFRERRSACFLLIALGLVCAVLSVCFIAYALDSADLELRLAAGLTPVCSASIVFCNMGRSKDMGHHVRIEKDGGPDEQDENRMDGGMSCSSSPVIGGCLPDF